MISRQSLSAKFHSLFLCGYAANATMTPVSAKALREEICRMSQRIDKSWVVIASIENAEGNRCVDLFFRPDGTYGFEEFRRDPEDAGLWTPVHYYSGACFPSKDDVLAAATNTVIWLAENLHGQSAKS